MIRPLQGVQMALLASLAAGLRAQPPPAWGIDACLTRHVSDAEFPAYVRLLQNSGVRIVREREVGRRRPDGTYEQDARDKFRALKAAGLEVVAFATLPVSLPVARPEDTLPEDLRAVFDEGARLERDCAGLVDAWEMVGEADVGFCRDLPDRSTAYQKALYLGLKSGARGAAEAPAVLMGALALPPGPWLERAARNGLLDYTDAYNFHFYGYASDLLPTIVAHRTFMESHGPPLPLWLTECGMKAVVPGQAEDPGRRQLQAEFTLATARAARAGRLSAFMPFILAEHDDPYALTLSAEHPFPAWNAYAALTRGQAGPARGAIRRAAPSSVVLQWLPDEGAAIPHKVSGAYRFLPRRPMAGELRIYNFGPGAAAGRLRTAGPDTISATFPRDLPMVIPAGGVITLRGSFAPSRGGYFQASWGAEFDGDDGSRSPLRFALEPKPDPADFLLTPLRLGPASSERSANLIYPDSPRDSQRGPWQGINGVQVDTASPSGGGFRVPFLTGDPVGDPLRPPMAVARLAGLPAEGFLVVRPDRSFGAESSVRIDLVDRDGQRFTVWENFGQSYFSPQRDLWLSLRDFHVYFWGRCLPRPQFNPASVRELQLRFYCAHAGDRLGLSFELAEPRRIAGMESP